VNDGYQLKSIQVCFSFTKDLLVKVIYQSETVLVSVLCTFKLIPTILLVFFSYFYGLAGPMECCWTAMLTIAPWLSCAVVCRSILMPLLRFATWGRGCWNAYLQVAPQMFKPSTVLLLSCQNLVTINTTIWVR